MGVVVSGSLLTSSLVFRVLTLKRLLPPKEGEVRSHRPSTVAHHPLACHI